VDTGVDTGADTAADHPIDTGVDAPWADGCTLDRSSPLFTVLLETEAVDDYQKERLCRCFAGLNASWNDGLIDLFATATPEQTASMIWEMVECCEFDSHQLETNFGDVRDQFLDGSLCYMALPYRGVTFPER
jgi:hypothetical protein